MPDLDMLYPSKYLRVTDLQGRRTHATITSATIETLGRGRKAERKLVVTFKETALKPLVLNEANSYTIAALTGTRDSDTWAGTALTLVATEPRFHGDACPSIRIEPALGIPSTPGALTGPTMPNAPTGAPWDHACRTAGGADLPPTSVPFLDPAVVISVLKMIYQVHLDPIRLIDIGLPEEFVEAVTKAYFPCGEEGALEDMEEHEIGCGCGMSLEKQVAAGELVHALATHFGIEQAGMAPALLSFIITENLRGRISAGPREPTTSAVL